MLSLPANIIPMIALGLTPSLVWLYFFARKDCHPEPKNLLAQTFLMGIIIAPLAIILQWSFAGLISTIAGMDQAIFRNSSYFFIWAAAVEEAIKFYAVRMLILRNPEFDEPVDAMIYMITAGLGFAAMENILVMNTVFSDGTLATLATWSLRFTGATLLHALSSGLLGYFLAMSWFFRDHRKKLLVIGFIIATIFHFVFNAFLSTFESRLTGLVYSTALLVVMAFLVSILFDKIKERHSGTSAGLATVVSNRVINLLK
ncbi:MAG: PrsW family intramembrane metalloprotease [Candidatus Yanofskybacteria bacterium]|nr:PrsW family intramembrane metalloprotease [Candidatus Yanofskybacteria bacterium]